MDTGGPFAEDLASTDPTRRRAAAERLTLAPDPAAAVWLARATGDTDDQVRQWASAALEELGPPDVHDLTALAELLADGEPDVRYWAATLLGRLGEQAEPAIGALRRALDDDPAIAVRQRIAWAFGQMGPAATDAREALDRASRSEDPRLARLAQAALRTLGDG